MKSSLIDYNYSYAGNRYIHGIFSNSRACKKLFLHLPCNCQVNRNPSLHAIVALVVLVPFLQALHPSDFRLLRAVNTEPDNARVIKMLGDVCNEIQDTKPAEEAYSRALSADPTSETALYGIGYLYYSGGMYSVAMEFLSRLIQLHPDHSNGRNLLGSCHFKMGNHRQTIEVYQPLVSSDEHTDHFSDIDYADVHSNVGEAFMKLGDPVSAEKHYRSALSINSSHAWTQFRLAYLYVQTNNLQKYPEAEQL